MSLRPNLSLRVSVQISVKPCDILFPLCVSSRADYLLTYKLAHLHTRPHTSHNDSMDHAAVDRLLASIQKEIGPGLIAAYRVPSAGDGYFLPQRFEDTLLLLFDPASPIHQAREALIAQNLAVVDTLEAPPIVATPASLARHVRLFPLFGHHLATHAELLYGERLSPEISAKPHLLEQLAFLVAEAIACSAALAPQNSEHRWLNRLHRLADHLSGNQNARSASPAELFAQVQVRLRLLFESLPMIGERQASIVESRAEPNVQAIYEDEQRLVVIIPPLSGDLLRQIDWTSLSRPMPAHLTALNVATAAQLFFNVQTERPMDFALGCYRRVWGAELLPDLSVSARAVFRQAARKPSALLVDGLLGAYLATNEDEGVHRVIHDYQNRLLNMRLEHELLSRFFGVSPAEPPEPLPRRDEPLAVRIDAIASHLDWWSDHYLGEMQARAADQKMSPVL